MKLVVVGDALLDIDILGSVQRTCPDSAAPVLDAETQLTRPGGAGLTALLAALAGAQTTLVTALADDHAGVMLSELLGSVELVATWSMDSTVVKTRLRADGRSIGRIDCASQTQTPLVTDDMLDAVASGDAVLVSDYGYGLAADNRLRRLLEQRADQVTVVWDPHARGPAPVSKTKLVTPNLTEAQHATGIMGHDLKTVASVATQLRQRWKAQAVAVTLGKQGALFVGDPIEPTLIPAPRATGADPCGAGDQFAAATAIELLRHAPADAAVAAGVAAATAFITRGGVASISQKSNLATPGPLSVTADLDERRSA